MRTGRTDHLWMIIGALVTALLIAVTYFGVVSTTRADAANIRLETDENQSRITDLRKRVANLAAEKKNEKKLIAERDTFREALPSGSGVPAFLRQLQVSGTNLDVDISGVTVGTPAEVTGSPGIWSIQIQLTAAGLPDDLNNFLRQLQGSSQKRAVLVDRTTLTIDEKPEDTQLDLTLNAFVAPPAGSGAPTVTTD